MAPPVPAKVVIIPLVRHLADGGVTRIGNVDVPRRIHRNAWAAQLRERSLPAIAAESRDFDAREGGNGPAAIYHANGVIHLVGDIQVPARHHGRERQVQVGVNAGPPSPAKPCVPLPASEVMMPVIVCACAA